MYEFGNFRLNVNERSLRSLSTGQPIALTQRAFDTLVYLVERRGQLVDKAALLKAIWPNMVVEENNLSQSITVIRRALGGHADRVPVAADQRPWGPLPEAREWHGRRGIAC